MNNFITIWIGVFLGLLSLVGVFYYIYYASKLIEGNKRFYGFVMLGLGLVTYITTLFYV